MRLEVVDRKLVQHMLVVAQIVLSIWAAPALCASWGDPALSRQSKPLILVIGSPTAHDWKLVEHPLFVTVPVHRQVHPEVAEAYERFAAIVGVTGEPLYVVTTPHLEPVAASRRDGLDSFLETLANRWTSDREQLTADAGLAVRRYLLEAHGDTAPAWQPLEQALLSPRYDVVGGTFFRSDTSFDKSLSDHIHYAGEALDSGQHEVARSILDYLISELQESDGVLAAGQHADSLVPRGGAVYLEGGHYLWTREAIQRVVGSRGAEIFSFHYGVPLEGESVPRVTRSLSETRTRFSLGQDEALETLRSARQRLLEVRSKRPDPLRDATFVTELNGQAISVFVRASILLNEQRYAEAALRAARGILHRNRPAGKLRRAGSAPAIAGDYAALTRALVDLYEITFDTTHLATAIDLRNEQRLESGAPRVPPPVAGLAKLRSASDDLRLEAIIASTPGQRQIIVSGNYSRDDTKALVQAARSTMSPTTTVFLITNNRTRSRLATWMPYVQEIVPIDDHAVAALCQQRTCSTPTTDPAVVAAW